MSEKRCASCQRRKPVESFYRNNRTKDGLFNRCKQCLLRERSSTPKPKARAVGGRNPSGKSELRPAADQPWREQALCRPGLAGGDWFDVPSGGLDRQRKAKLVELTTCQACSVLAECLEYGLKQPFGIWGGQLPRERIKLRRRK